MDMKNHNSPERASSPSTLIRLSAVVFSLGMLAWASLADQLEMVNGDTYSGSVLAVNLTNVTFRSEIQGTITLPRTNVARITFREPTGGTAARAALAPSALQSPRLGAALEMPQQLQPKGA